MDLSVLFKIEYGLYLLTANENKDNGCIINTLSQVTSNPNRISITINKDNYTTKMIQDTSKFNVSILSEDVTFDVIKQFGFKSGRTCDKFSDFPFKKRADNGILYLNKFVNSVVMAQVYKEIDLGTHILFIADLKDTIKISDTHTVSYNYYQKNIKPKPQTEIKIGYRCKICNYIYEGETLPIDFVCPLCKHPASDFERL